MYGYGPVRSDVDKAVSSIAAASEKQDGNKDDDQGLHGDSGGDDRYIGSNGCDDYNCVCGADGNRDGCMGVLVSGGYVGADADA